MGRYSLILDEELKDRKIIEISKASKTSLKKIDLITTKASCKEELLKLIGETTEGENYDFYITYRHDGKEKRLPIAYVNKDKLANVRMDNDSTVDTEDAYFRQILRTFLDVITRDEYVKILNDDEVLNLKLQEYIEKWLYEEKSTFNHEKVAQYMSSYKQLRAIIFSFEEYNRRNKLKIR